jgi:hypothetical protein
MAVKRLHEAIKLGRTTKIIESANHAVTAVMEVADLVTVQDKDADTFVTIQASVTGCLDAMNRAVRAKDAGGVLSSGELVGDAVKTSPSF